MNDALTQVTKWLLYASSQVGEQYSQLAVAERIQNISNVSTVMNFIIVGVVDGLRIFPSR